MINSKQQAHNSAEAIASFTKIGTKPCSLKNFLAKRRAICAAIQQPTIKAVLIPKAVIDILSFCLALGKLRMEKRNNYNRLENNNVDFRKLPTL